MDTTTTPTTRWLTTNEAAAYLGIHPETVRYMCRRRDLRSARVGNRYRLKIADLDHYMENHQ